MSAVSRILLKLAASEYTLSELKEFLLWIDRTGGREALSTIEDLRMTANRKNLKSSRSDPYRSSSSDSVPVRVERLLVEQGGMLKSEAVEALIRSMSEDGSFPSDLSRPKKTSFADWLSKLSQYTSESAVLHHATKILNSRHGRKEGAAWPLRSNEE